MLLKKTTDELEEGEEKKRIFRTFRLGKREQPQFCTNFVATAKYSWINFWPIFLFNYLKNFANGFYLFVAILQQIPDLSPSGRFTSVLPLIVITILAAIKEIIEDLRRRKGDRLINHSYAEVLREGDFQKILWQDIIVSDIVKVTKNDYFPADMVLLSTSQEDRLAWVETCNLDGETSLKYRTAVKSTQHRKKPHELKLEGRITCSPVSTDLYSFSGTLWIDDEDPQVLGSDHLVQRGVRLLNTQWAVGLVVYTGHQTRLSRNSKKTSPFKQSRVDRLTSKNIMLLFTVLGVMSVANTVWNHVWKIRTVSTHWYLGVAGPTDWKAFFNSLVKHMLLFHNIIPISLTISVEAIRFYHAMKISRDPDMLDENNEEYTEARSSNLNEDLGQIGYIFSDKTGTLTLNIMEFRKAFVGGRLLNSGADMSAFFQEGDSKSLAGRFRSILTLCHEVVPEPDPETNRINYRSASPDEKALVQEAAAHGWVVADKHLNLLTVLEKDQECCYEILHTLQFTSERKRMSVIVRMTDGEVVLFSKGADEVIFPRLAPDQENIRAEMNLTLLSFASQGFRTLACAFRVMPPQYQSWSADYQEALESPLSPEREQLLEDLIDEVEQDLTLIGVVAIEDRLQDQVGETIEAFFEAGIRIWVLTGDKPETAINIGYSCRLLSHDMRLVLINRGNVHETIEEELKRRHTSSHPQTALVVDGHTLNHIWSDPISADFIRLGSQCRAVICCRVGPSQKASVVKAVKVYTGAVTLAIGDGGNDVPMIQMAHVGVGVKGQEGIEAACSSDFSTAQFRFLRKLLLVHGASSFFRINRLTMLCLYKNTLFSMMALWFSFYSGFSEQTFFERWTSSLYNAFFTVVPAFTLALSNVQCTAQETYDNPRLYSESLNGKQFSKRNFVLWVSKAAVHSALLFWLSMIVLGNCSVWPSGYDGGHYFNCFAVYSFVLMVVTYKAGLEMNSWSWLAVFVNLASLGAWYGFVAAYSTWAEYFPSSVDVHGLFSMMMTSSTYWLGMVTLPLTVFLFDLVTKTFLNEVAPTLSFNFRREINNGIFERRKLKINPV